MKVTFDIPRTTKNALEDLKSRLRRKGLPAFERAIICRLVETADSAALEKYFSGTKGGKRKSARKGR